ncbi:uncharacterized protein METZ01_LOCUS311732, partial [marine metagenome]
DEEDQSNTATVTITVNAVNDPPIVQDLSVFVQEDGTTNITLVAYDEDSDDNLLVFDIVDSTSHGSLTVNARALDMWTYTPHSDYDETDSFTYRAFDGDSLSAVATVTIMVTAVNDPPVASNVEVASGGLTSFTFPITDYINDIETDDSGLSVDFVYGGGINGGAIEINDLMVTYTMEMSTDIDYIPYRVSDGVAMSTMSLLTITDLPGMARHNREALFAVNDTVFVTYGSIIQLTLQGLDVSTPFEQLTIDTTSTPVNGSLTNLSSYIHTDGEPSTSRTADYTPTINVSSIDSVLFRVTNSASEELERHIFINIIPVNLVPTLSSIDDQFEDEDGADITVFINPTDPNTNDLLTVSVTSNNTVLLPNGS